MTFTDDEIKNGIEQSERIHADLHYVNAAVMWAAEQYLKAKPVIEWYADKENYERKWDAAGEPMYIKAIDDFGNRAREFLNGEK